MLEVNVNGLTQQYRTKPTMNINVTGSSASVQSDWNQNDDTKPDYVKNRPFYAEPIDGVIFSNDSVVFSDGMAELGEGELSSDSIYTVTFDGTVYDNLVPFYNYGEIIIGSPYDAMSDAMPFCISGHGNSLFIVTNSPEETHSITIYRKGPGIHTIDASYTNIYMKAERFRLKSHGMETQKDVIVSQPTIKLITKYQVHTQIIAMS